MENKNYLKKVDIRTLKYNKGEMELCWSVDYNKKKDLSDSIELFQRAIDDIKEALKIMSDLKYKKVL